MKSQIVANPMTPKKIQIARYHDGSHSYTASPPTTRNATPHASRDRSAFTRTKVLL